MAKKINPLIYRSFLYKNPLILQSSYSFYKYTNLFVKLLIVYQYLLVILNRFLTINIFKHPYLIQNKILKKQLYSGETKILKKKKRAKLISRLWFQEYFRWNRFYVKNNKQKLSSSKKFTYKQLSKFILKWNSFYKNIKNAQIDNTIYNNFFQTLFNLEKITNKISTTTTNLPLSLPVAQNLRQKVSYPKTTRFFPISDLYIVSDKYNLNIFISYLTPPVYTFRYFLAFYKKLLKYKYLTQRLNKHLIYSSHYILTKTEYNVSRGGFNFFFKNYKNLFFLQKNNQIPIFNTKFILFLKTNLQKFYKTKVNLFFFNNRDFFLYAVRNSNLIRSSQETSLNLYSLYSQLQQNLFTTNTFSYFSKLKMMLYIKKFYNSFIGLKFVSSLAKTKKFIPALSSKMTVSLFLICLQQAIITGSAKSLSDVIVFQFKRAQNQTRFYYYLKKILYIFFRRYNQIPEYLKGLKIVISGRLNGRSRSNKRIITLGKIGLISKDQILDFSKDYVTTRYGVIGIKVYLFF